MLLRRKAFIMGSLVKFEIKKICSRRVLQISLGVILAMLCYITFFNITSQYALNPDEVGEELEGTAAIAQIKANADMFAGPITDEGAAEVLREFKTFIDSEGEVKDEYRADGPTPGANAAEYWSFISSHNDYLSLLTHPWMNGFQTPASAAATIDTTNAVNLYDQVHAKIESQLENTQGVFAYNDAEKDFWLSKAESVPTPVEYGYAGGWEDFINLAQYLIFAIIVAVIACASVFNVEYREKTDAVLLSTRFGKTRLGKAKIIAALIVSSCIYWLMALVLLIVPLVFFGADGAGLRMQVLTLTNTYGMSLSAASFACCLIGYLAMLGVLGIVLALSARVRSSMGILAVGVAIVMIPMFVPNLHNSIANHVLFLFPYLALNPRNLFDMVSYSFGSAVVEYPVVVCVLYALLFVGGSLLAGRSFSRHQAA